MSLANRIQRPTVPDRVTMLERRADAHDKMATQVAEMYELLTRWRNINWFFVKVGAYLAGGLGAIAVLLTIIDKVLQLAGHH